jgi:hypothetical protein
MPTITLTELRHRYDAYKESVLYLAMNRTTVPGRKAAIQVRDEFERDIRDGILDGLFAESENWS